MSVTFTDEDDPFAIASEKLGHINEMSGFQWVGCGDGIYVIELVGKGFIRIEPHGMEVN
jgi:ATP-dependent helicase IRC3